MNEKLKSIFAMLMLVAVQVSAQQVEFFRTELSLNSNAEKYRDINGSPYLFEKWLPGTVTTIDKGSRKDIPLKYDEVDDILIMKGDNDNMLTFSVPVHEFVILDPKSNTERKFRSGFAATKMTSEKSFFEVLADGKVKLLKKNHKIISESKEYSGAVKKSVSDGIKYYLVNGEQAPVVVKLDLKSITAILPDRETQVSAYTKEHKLNLKNQEDAAKLVVYLNSL